MIHATTRFTDFGVAPLRDDELRCVLGDFGAPLMKRMVMCSKPAERCEEGDDERGTFIGHKCRSGLHVETCVA